MHSSLRLRPALLLCMALAGPLVLSSATGCTQVRPPELPDVELPAQVSDEAELRRALNALALLPPGPQAAALRDQTVAYLVLRVDSALEAGNHGDAVTSLQYAATTYGPSEMRESPVAVPELARAARMLYTKAAQRGREMPALFALGVAHQFGTRADKAWAVEEWGLLGEWVERGADFSRDPLHPSDKERLLEQTVSIFPSPWLTDELATRYLTAYLEAKKDQRMAALGVRNPRVEFTGYFLARLYLRADDFESALRTMGTLELDEPSRSLRDMIATAAEAEKGSSVQPLVDLASYFQPDEADQLPDSVITQGWGIVENMSKRALRRKPGNVHASLGLARAYRQYGLNHAALFHYERAMSKDVDSFSAFEELALVYQLDLMDVAGLSPAEAMALLPKIEAFHRRAAAKWRDRPIEPTLTDAQLTVASAFFDDGEPAKAKELCQRSLDIEPRPEALDLLGTIAFKAGHYDQAQEHFEKLTALPFDDQLERMTWEIRARKQLAETALALGKHGESRRQLQGSLRQLNVLLSFPQLPSSERASRLSERAVVFFYLGDLDQAMKDFREAASAAPGSTQVYADSLVFTIQHGFLAQANEVLNMALLRDEIDPALRVYFSLWVADLAVRQGAVEPRDAREYLASYEGEEWAEQLAAHGLGKRSFEELLARATDRGQRAEAHFYEGLRLWRAGKRDEALGLMKQVMDSKMMSFFEYEMAQHYLAWRELPLAARAPLPTAQNPK